VCSPEAARAGISPGLPLREVLTICGDAIIRQPDPVLTATVLGEVLGTLQRVGPSVEAADERLFLDLRGLQGIYQHSLDRLARAIRAAVPPLLQPRIGIAAGKRVAAIAARQAPLAGMCTVPEQETARFLAPLSIDHLSLAPDIVKRLERLGLRTIADLAALPFSAVQAAFGPVGAQAWRLAHGQDETTVVPHQIAATVSASLRFDHPLGSVDAILAAVRSLLAHAFADPALRGRAARQARLRAALADDSSWEQLITFKEAVSNKRVAYTALKSKLQLPNALPLAPVDELALELLGIAGEAAKQPSLFLARARRGAEIVEATRHLQARYGHTPVYRAMEVEPWSRVPERRWALIPYEP
jgi:DNA polymerase-4/protein ImuB